VVALILTIQLLFPDFPLKIEIPKTKARFLPV